MSRLVTVVACLLVLLIPIANAARNIRYRHNPVKVQHLLNRLNKPPVKSIQSQDGDIIDCILMNQQPAFDHPLLKDHVIQMRPSCEPEGEIEESNDHQAYPVWHNTNETCPEGTVAIRRTKEEDLLRANSLEDFGKNKFTRNSSSSHNTPSVIRIGDGHEYGVVDIGLGNYHGAKTAINLWKPQVQKPDEFSLSQLWILSGSFDDDTLNTVEAGWQVFPNLYGDWNPRLFTFWTRDAYKSTGCYNLVCSGFVQVSRKYPVGASIGPVSVYGGRQYEIVLQVWKNDADKKWWLKLGNEVVGYWPTALFTGLANAATDVQFGGEITNYASNGHTATDMGSGHFPGQGYGKASYFRDFQTMDSNGKFQYPVSLDFIASRPNCYNALNDNNPIHKGTLFYYGGPGQNPNCP